jgi:hypothetical protein
MLKPNFKSPVVLCELFVIGAGVVFIALAIYFTITESFGPFMLLFYATGLMPLVGGTIMLVGTVHEQRADEWIRAR